MPHSKNQRPTRDRGQILIVFVISLVVMVLMAGLVVDAGFAFTNRRDAQNASDLGAMAGTKRLADYYVKSQAFASGNNVYSAVNARMTANGCTAATDDDDGCTWTARYSGPRTGATFQDLGAVGVGDTAPPGAGGGQKALGVKVDVTRTPRTFFLGIIGQETWTVGTTATAITGQPAGAPAGQLLPIGLVAPPTMSEGSIYSLTNGADGPGNFGWISWTGSNNAGELATSLCTPNNPPFVLPIEYPGDPGKTNATDVRACLQQWVDNQATVLIPIVEKVNDPSPGNNCSTGGNGNSFHYCIVGIAAFVITGYAQPAVDQINGRFVGTTQYSSGSTVPGGITAPPAPGSQFYLLGLAQ